MEAMVGRGAAVKTNPSSRMAVSVLGLCSGSGLTTVTSTVPYTPAGARTSIVVPSEETLVTEPETPLPARPNVTRAPRAKSVPVRCTTVLPRVFAVAGAIEVSVGAPAGPVFVNVLVAIWPSGFLTVTVLVPPGAFGTRPTIRMGLRTIGFGGTGSKQVVSGRLVWPGTKLTGTHRVDPTETIAGEAAFEGSAKPEPSILIWVPLVPVVGSTEAIVGGAAALKVKAEDSVSDWPSSRVTVTSTAPAACPGVLAAIVVALRAAALAAAVPPNETVVPALKLVPEIVSCVPPSDVPDATESVVMSGAGAAENVKAPVFVALPPPRLVTTTSTCPAAWAGVFAVICVPSAETTTLVPVRGESSPLGGEGDLRTSEETGSGDRDRRPAERGARGRRHRGDRRCRARIGVVPGTPRLERAALAVRVEDDDVGRPDDAGRRGHEDARGAQDRDRRARQVVREAGRSVGRPKQDLSAGLEMGAGDGDVGPAGDRARCRRDTRHGRRRYVKERQTVARRRLAARQSDRDGHVLRAGARRRHGLERRAGHVRHRHGRRGAELDAVVAPV